MNRFRTTTQPLFRLLNESGYTRDPTGMTGGKCAQRQANFVEHNCHTARSLRIIGCDMFDLRAEIGAGRIRPFNAPHS